MKNKFQQFWQWLTECFTIKYVITLIALTLALLTYVSTSIDTKIIDTLESIISNQRALIKQDSIQLDFIGQLIDIDHEFLEKIRDLSKRIQSLSQANGANNNILELDRAMDSLSSLLKQYSDSLGIISNIKKEIAELRGELIYNESELKRQIERMDERIWNFVYIPFGSIFAAIMILLIVRLTVGSVKKE